MARLPFASAMILNSRDEPSWFLAVHIQTNSWVLITSFRTRHSSGDRREEGDGKNGKLDELYFRWKAWSAMPNLVDW